MTPRYSIVAAVLAALLFGVATPFAKQLLGEIPSTLLAGLLGIIGAEIENRPSTVTHILSSQVRYCCSYFRRRVRQLNASIYVVSYVAFDTSSEKYLMKANLRLILLYICGIAVIAQNASAAELSPEAVVRAYTDAANRHDLEGFLALYATDIRKFRFPGEMASQGIEHNREVYTKSFAMASDLKIEIVEMIALADKVMVHDRVTGRPDGKIADELTIYQVQQGKIMNIVYVDQQAH